MRGILPAFSGVQTRHAPAVQYSAPCRATHLDDESEDEDEEADGVGGIRLLEEGGDPEGEGGLKGMSGTHRYRR